MIKNTEDSATQFRRGKGKKVRYDTLGVTQDVKAIQLFPAKLKGNGQSQTSSLGRPRPSANRGYTLLLYHESFAYKFSVGERSLGLGLGEN
ncbi:hypothetical protein AVEN_173263-1 [Araneus ventricosus]|uniref:Uncharacterized protein n=1 Tax=Araneus ventricosus TaxID=182803 RepID=A0A4Y2HFS1_ARAVE|nr:hypothetical protein AVEN_173263-1 [Araneus ventricosus]